MYCRCCGKELNANMGICMGCGVPVGKGKNFCPACGTPTNEEAVMCVNCGVGFIPPTLTQPKGAKSRVAAGILAIFFGCLGVHNFYINRNKRAVVQLLLSLTLVVDFIAAMVVDAVYIAGYDTGVAEIIVSLMATIGFVCLLAAGIWGFIEAIMLLCGATEADGNGNPFKD